MNQTLCKKLLICYHFGARGDFLASILAGDKLKMCYKNPWITHPNADFIKIHNPGPNHKYFVSGNLSSDEFEFNDTVQLKFNTIKISLNSYDDKIECALLKLTKDQRLTPTNILQHMHMGEEHINDIKAYDHLFNYDVCYKSLWNIEYIENLYSQVTGGRLTNDDLDRINYNILINRKLIDSAKSTIGHAVFEKFYNHFFNNIPYN